MITRLRYPKGYQFFDANGAPLALGNLHYYAAGTTTLQDTYSDSAGTVLNTNPIVLDGSGRLDVDIYLGSTANYKEVLTTASTTVSPWPDDNIPLASQADWNATSGPNQILNKPALAAVATSGSYADLSNTPSTDVPFTGDHGSGGTSGLVPAPAAGNAVANMFLSAAGGWATPPGSSGSSATNLSVTETGSSVGIGSSSGTGITIPAATSTAAGVLDSTRAAKVDGLATVATSGSYADLSNKPGDMAGAASGAAGEAGFVPPPAAGQQGLFLRGDATWAAPSGGSGSGPTNLSASETANSVSIGSSTGTGATIGAATSTTAGVLDSTRAAKIDGLATVATSGSYADLANTPPIPSIPGALSGQDIDNVARLGINTTDAANLLSVNAPSVLFSNSGDMRTTISKGASSNTAAIDFQDDFSTRAQFGLLGNDSLTISTSPDGSTFNNAIVATAAGSVSFPNTGGFTGDSGSGGASGLVPAPAAGTAAGGKFLKADGTWSVPPGTASVMTGASASTAGASGLVPVPSSGQQGSFLRGDGAWQQMTAGQVSGLASSATLDTTNASNITSGTLPAAQLPNPSASALGGVQSATASTNQFMTGIDTSGVPQFARPSASNISGLGALATQSTVDLASEAVSGAYTVALNATANTSLSLPASGTLATTSQLTAGNISGLAASATTDTTDATNITSGTLPAAQLPGPSASALGGVQSAAASSNEFMTGIDTSGVPQFAQPSAANISGLGALATQSAVDLSSQTTGSLSAASVSGISGTYAPLAGPALTGTPTAPTQSAGDNSTAIATTAYLDSKLGANSGIATLDGGGKLASSQIPASLVGAVVYQGVWNASTNTPPLANGMGTQGHYYKVSVAGTAAIDGNSQWNVGDTIIFDGSAWDRIAGNSPEVLSVAGLYGAISASGLKSALAISSGDVSGLGTLATQSTVDLASEAVSATYTVALNATGNTNLSLPTSGTLATTSQLTAGNISGLAASATTDTTNATNITSGTLAAALLPNPTASALGGVQSGTASSNQFMTGIDTSGVPQFAQPSASNISGLGALATQSSVDLSSQVTGQLPYSSLSGTPTLGSLAGLSSVNNSNWSGTALSIANGGTGQGTASAAFDAISPMTTAGDIIIGGAGGAAQRLGSAFGGVSPLALGVGARSIAAQNQALLKQASVLPTPTIYYDPTATGGNGSGASAANACYTIAQLQSATSGDMSGQVIGFAYGTATASEVYLTLGASDTSKPVIICPYNNGNNSTALPMIDCGAVLSSGWSVYSGAIYQNTIGGTVLKQPWQKMPDGTERRLMWVYASSQSAMLSQLATAGPGYCCFYGGVLYVIPYNNVAPSTGVIVVPSNATPTMGAGGGGLVINYKNQAASGNIIVYGIAVRHTFGSGIFCSLGASSGSIASLGPVFVVGCDVEHCGRPQDVVNAYGNTICPNGGGDDGIIVYGKNNTIRTQIRIANNYTNDVGNNGVEIAFVSGGYNEFNFHLDTCSHAISEHWASVANVVTRYNYANFVQNAAQPWYNGASAQYMGRLILQTAYDQTNYQSGSAETPATAAQSGNNSWIGNIAINCPAGCGGDGTAIVDDGVSGLVFRYNTFHIKSLGNNVCQPLIFGNLLNATNFATPPAVGVVWSNNIFINLQASLNSRMMYVSPNYNSGYVPNGDNNIWYSTAGAWYNDYKINTTDVNSSTGPLTLAAWAAATGMDAHSQWINPGVDANGQPYPFSPAIRCGAYASFLNFNEGSPLFDTIAASSISGLAASATTDTTNATNIASGTLAAARLPTPSASALGGVQSATASSNQFMTGINTSGVPQFAQPSASNISGLGSLATLNSLASSNLSDHTSAGIAMFTAASAAAQTALLSVMAGDSGAGGTAGLVPAPSSGAATAGKFLKADGTWSVPSGGSGGGTVVRGALAGLILSNDGTSPNSVLDISAGQCSDSSAAVYITLSSAFTKSTAGSWTLGSGNNGMGNGLTVVNSTWYHVFSIINSGSADVYFDTSSAAANAPSGTTSYRRIGSFLTDGSAHILAFVQDADTFYWSANPQPLDISTTSLGATSALYTLSVPLGIKTRPILRATTSTSNAIIISSPDQPDVSPSATTANALGDVTANWNIVQEFYFLYTNTSSQIRARATASSTSLYVRTLGYVDARGRYS